METFLNDPQRAATLADAHWLGCSYVITSVTKAKADVTNSFALTGAREEEKRFVDERIVVQDAVAAPQSKA